MSELEPGVCRKFHRAVEFVGGRWTGAILEVLLRGPARYAELRDAVPGISDRMLCRRLRELEEEEVALRRVIAESPVRVEYELTDKGRALEASVRALAAWAERWVEAPAEER